MDRPDDKQHQVEFNAKQGEPDTMTMDGLEDNVLASYLTKDSVLVILMKSSIVDKDVTIKSLQQDHGFNLLGQHTLQLVSSQVDTLYGYDVVGTKPHYKELYEGWKKSSLSDPVQVLVLEKEKAVDSFQALVNLQNSTKKKNRVMDPQSVYASINQDNVKRDINLLLGTSGSNNLGVSSAVVQPPFETVTGSMQNQDSSLGNDNDTMVNSILDDSPVTFDTQSSAKPDLGTLEAIVNDDPSLVKKVDSDLGSSPENHIAVIDTPGSLNKTVDNDPSELSSPIAKVTTISESPATETDLSPPIAKDTNIAPESTPSPATETELSTPIALDTNIAAEPTAELPHYAMETEILPPTAEDNKFIEDSTTELPPSDIETEILQPTAEDNKIIDDSTTELPPSDIGTEILQPTAEDNKIIDESITKSPSPTIDSDTENVGNKSTEGTTPNNVSATEKSAGNQQDSSTRQKPRDTLQANKKKQTSTVKPTTTRKVTTSDIKTNKTAAPPQPPLKSKLRTPTAAPTTRPAAAVKPPIKQKQAPSSKEKPTEGTIKKTTPRVPRVALLTPKPPPSLAKKDDEPPKRRPTTISKDAIARLAAPTASSARRQQGASVTTTPPTKGASVTATFKLEQRKIRPTRPAVATKKTGPITGDKKETAVKKVDNKKQEPLEKITTTPSTEKAVEETAIPSPTDKAPRSPAESSTTSSRPQTPEPPAKPPMLEPKLQKPPVATNTVKNLLARFN